MRFHRRPDGSMPDEDDGDAWLWLIRGTGPGDYLARLRKLEQTWSVALGACDLNRDKIKALWYHTREAEAPSDEDEDSDEPMEVTEYWELVGLRLFMYNALHQKVCGTTWDTMALEPTFTIDPRVCRRSCTTQSLSLAALSPAAASCCRTTCSSLLTRSGWTACR